MKRQKGFSLIEVLIATAVMVGIVGATVGALTDATRATQAVVLMADTQENLRAGMNYITRDLSQAGEGIPQGGITIPTTGVVWPGTGGNFASGSPATNWSVLPAISPGYELGPVTSTSNLKTDVLTITYGDTTLQDTNFTPAHWLNEYPINLTSSCPSGSITNTGSSPSVTTTVVFDATHCVHINTGNTGLSVGDLILLQNNASSCSGGNSIIASESCDTNANGGTMALRVITGVNTTTNTITFAPGSPGDPFGLNGGTLTTGGTWTATRVWMITYYINNSNTLRPQLMREVNLKGANAVGDVIENFQVFYDLLNPSATPPAILSPQEQESPAVANLPYIRDAYVFLAARSSSTYSATGQYFRNNLETVVSIRGLAFYNEYN
jgi:prepilin-type N-terminal cleavage/methylation domain-containing protein